MRVLTILFFSSIIFFSCSAERRVNKYYLIDANPTIAETELENGSTSFNKLPFNAEIRKFVVSKPYDQTRIVLRTKSNEINYYYYHSWAEPPSTAITFFVWEKIKESELFSAFDFVLYDTPAEFVVIGSVNQIERIGNEDNPSAHLKMSFDLVEKENAKIVVVHKIDRFAPIRQNASMNIFAQEINKMLDEETKAFLNKISEKLTASNNQNEF